MKTIFSPKGIRSVSEYSEENSRNIKIPIYIMNLTGS